MSKAPSERTRSITQLRQAGKRQADIARQLGMSPAHVREIVKREELRARRRQGLVERYGAQPDIASLHDSTPIEVLELCDGDVHGWTVRVGHLEHVNEFPLRTLGDLRRISDAQLLKLANVGRRMVAELRRHCPPVGQSAVKGDEELERVVARLRLLLRARKRRIVPRSARFSRKSSGHSLQRAKDPAD